MTRFGSGVRRMICCVIVRSRKLYLTGRTGSCYSDNQDSLAPLAFLAESIAEEKAGESRFLYHHFNNGNKPTVRGSREHTMIKWFGKTLSTVAAIGMLCPAPLMAYDTPTPDSPAPAITDVALSSGGILAGRVVSPTGSPVSGIPVRIVNQGKIVAQASTSADGAYRFKGLRNGVHVVQTSQHTTNCRFWVGHTAPPTAHRTLAIVHDETIVRGNCNDGCNNGCNDGLSPGLLLGGGLFAAAAATTLATTLDNTAASIPSSP